MEIIFLAVVIVAALGGGAAIMQTWIKASPDEALIISGFRKKSRILVGQGGCRIPIIERVDRLYLGQVTVDIKTKQAVPTNDFINVYVDAVAKVAVADDEEGRLLAARNFLNLEPRAIADQLRDSLEGNMREIVGTLSLKEINTNRDSFSDQVMKKAADDMRRLGIKVISCNIQNITDETGLISDLGADNTAKIRKDASIAKALADRDVAIQQAEAAKESNDAQVKAELEIAQRQNELAIRKAELKKESDIKRAEADAAYAIQEQQQKKAIETATVDAAIARTQREQELKKQQVAVREQELAAQVQKKADAEKYEIEKKAAADLARRQRDAEAELYEKQRTAEAQKAKAEAELFEQQKGADAQKARAEAELFEQQRIAEAQKLKSEVQKYSMEQEAEGIKAKAQAEAEAIRLKGEAEAKAVQAKGEAEAAAMEKKALAYQKYNHAAMAQMAMEILPKVAAEIARPLSQIDKVTIFGGNGSSGVDTVSGNVPIVMAQAFQALKAATGVDLGDIIRGQSGAETTQNVKVNDGNVVVSTK